MKQKFVSFYADRDGNDYYSSCGKKLKERLDELGVRSSIEEMESFNDYMLNCLQKPKFMLKSLKESKEPIIWLDVDVTVNELPTELSDLDDDVILVREMIEPQGDKPIVIKKGKVKSSDIIFACTGTCPTDSLRSLASLRSLPGVSICMS